MRYCSLVTVLLLSACSFRAPRGIPVRVSAKVRVDVHVQGRAAVDTVVVPLQGAPVVEFFGIPLADAREVLFVLDVSGSMAENAAGQLAMIAPPPPVDQPPEPSPPATPPPATNAVPGEPVPPDDPPPPPPSPDASPQPMPDHRIGTRVPTKMEVAQAELIDAIIKLPAGTRMNVLTFSDHIDAYAPSLVVIDEQSRSDLIAFVREMRADGATALQPALRTGFLLNSPRIVLLSDGLGNIGGDREDIMRDVREAIRGGVRIDTIGIGPGQDTKLLTALAGETGGLYQRF
jgi:hypothetical protein